MEKFNEILGAAIVGAIVGLCIYSIAKGDTVWVNVLIIICIVVGTILGKVRIGKKGTIKE